MAKEVKYEANGTAPSRMQIMRSLRRSRVRTETAMYLYKIYPESSYPANISREIDIDQTNILGGLRGMGSRFDRSSSLVGMGIVDKVEEAGETYYRLSELGKSLMDGLNGTKMEQFGHINNFGNTATSNGSASRRK
ncbi:MAG: archaellum operon transcriptional activator EarA family protein [Methanocellales archaeon]|nr:archaellum operon transcriptional activator EarA family protein [Methanocellales archaeon]MDD5447283.1 archaellum operon transcriptional activator EarA family protein [Methanocellales archaeon]